MNRLEWSRRHVVSWIRRCQADNGSPRFVKFDNEVERTRSVLAVCANSQNRVPGTDTLRFTDIDDEGVNLLVAGKPGEWSNLVRSFGVKKTDVELLHADAKTVEVRLN